MTKQKYLIFVIETDRISQTDDTYISKYLSIHHASEMQSGLLIVRFVYMSGKTKFKSREVVYDTNGHIRLAKSMRIDYSVVYCFDTDRMNKQDKKLLKDAKVYVDENNYEFVLFNPKIEPVFGIKEYNDKIKAAKLFKSMKITKSNLDINIFTVPTEKVYQTRGTSNLEIVLKKIFGGK